MFNTYHAGNTNIKINAVTGAILKNHPKSWFERFNLKSPRASQLLTSGGHTFDRWREERLYNEHKGIIVLQMVVCGDMEVMAELVYINDYNTVETPKE